MVKDHSDSERENLLLPHGLLFLISSKGSFICTIPDRIAHTTAFVTPVVEHWLEREIAQWVHPMKDRSDDPSHHERTLLPRSYISLLLYSISPYFGEMGPWDPTPSPSPLDLPLNTHFDSNVVLFRVIGLVIQIFGYHYFPCGTVYLKCC